MYMEFIRNPYEFLKRNVTLTSRTLAIAPQSPLKAGLHSRMIMVAVTYNLCSSAADCDEEDLDIKIPQSETVTPNMKLTIQISRQKTTERQSLVGSNKKQ